MSKFVLSVIAASGQKAPGTSGTYGDFFQLLGGPPIISIQDGGAVAYAGSISPGSYNTEGIWYHNREITKLIAQVGQAAPGTSGTFQNVLGPFITASGSIQILGIVGGNYGVWNYSGGQLSLAALVGQQAPGLPAGINFKSVQGQAPFGFPYASNGAQSAFMGYTTVKDMNKDSGIWASAGGSAGLVFQSGVSSPLLPMGFTVDAYITGPCMNAAGNLIFSSTCNNTQSSGVFLGNATAGFQMLVKQNDPAPGTSSTFSGLQSYLPAINNANQYAILADSFAGTGIWAKTTGNLQLVAINGQAATGFPLGWTFFGGGFFNPLMDGNGNVYFYGAAQGASAYHDVHGKSATNASANGLWSWNAGSGLSLIAAGGQQAPGTSLNFDLGFVGALAVSDTGMAFSGTLSDSTQGIWYKRTGQNTQLLIQENVSTIMVNGTSKLVKNIYAMPSGANQNGMIRGMNNGSEIIFLAKFSDGSSAIIKATPLFTESPKKKS